MNNTEKYENMYKYILDESNQLIAIAAKDDYRLLYVNKPLMERAKNNDMDYHNMKCREYMGECDECSNNCPLMKILGSDENNNETEYTRNGRAYHIKLKSINWMGIDAFIMYATDITVIKRAQEIFETQMKMLIQSVPDAQGIFHFNITKNKWISSIGQSSNVDKIQNQPDVDSAIERIADFIPDTVRRNEFVGLFNRKSMQKAYDKGVPQIVKEVRSFYEDGSIKWTRMTARLLMNPKTGNLECILYGMDISGEKEYEQKIELAKEERNVILEMSKLDMLTGLYSKTTFINILEKYIKSCDSTYGLIFLDVDHFKNVNDTLGHIIGDRLIIRAGQALKEVFTGDDIVARFGGDEFCVLAKGITRSSLEIKLNHVLQRFDTDISESGKVVHISASMGVVFCEPGSDYKEAGRNVCSASENSVNSDVLTDISCDVSAMQLIELADEALYQAKRNGRNQYSMVKK